MTRYTVFLQDTNTAATTIGYFVNGATSPQNLILYEFTLDSDASPSNQGGEFQIRYVTDENATPGGTAITPFDLNRAIANTALSNAVQAPTGEPTYTSTVIMYGFALNQQATYTWKASPGSEFISADTEDVGFSLFAVSTSSAANHLVNFLYIE